MLTTDVYTRYVDYKCICIRRKTGTVNYLMLDILRFRVSLVTDNIFYIHFN